MTDPPPRDLRIQAALDAKAKPPGALGRLDALAARVAAVQGTLQPNPDPARVVVFVGDHGVADHGVSAYPAAVTPAMARTIAAGGAAVSVLARSCGASVEVVDVGIDADLAGVAGVVDAKVARGTQNLACGPAMTAAERDAAWAAGAAAARRAAEAGVRTLVPGEVGIGNTTAAAAVLAALLGWAPEEAVGRGTGVDDDGLARKTEAVRAGLAHVPRGPAGDAATLDVLGHVGGFEIAAMAGAFVETPSLGLVAVVDGFVATAAAAVAVRHDPAVAGHLVAGHVSAEAAHRRALAALGLTPILDLAMRLGEGTGAVLALPILRAACAVLREMATLDEALALEAP